MIAKADGGPVVFYTRFFLHSIPENAHLGNYFAAEFPTDKNDKNAEVHTKHHRRFQNGPAFGEVLPGDYGFTVIEEHEGTGLSPYKGEDPELYRVIARHS